MDDLIRLDGNFSTTQLLTKEKSILKRKPEYKLEPKLFLTPNPTRKGEGGLRTKGSFKKSILEKPLISVVTVVYNGELYLEQTIKSVIDQSYDNIEYIIIDGGSTDSTLDIVKKYEDKIDYWISEPDHGIYNAMNKGITLTTGKYIGFLNADDWYNYDAIENIVFSLHKNDPVFIFANVDFYSHDNIFTETMSANIENYKRTMPFGHPSLFVKNTLIQKILFDEQYPTASDYDFICKLILEKYPYLYLDKSIVNFRLGGISTTANTDKELFTIRYKHFGFVTALYAVLTTTNRPLISTSIKLLLRMKHFLKKITENITK